MEVTHVEQRACIKIIVLRGRNKMECHSEFVEALGNNALPYRTVARWVRKFHLGRASTSDEQRSGRIWHVPSSSSSGMKTDNRNNKDRSRNSQQTYHHVNFLSAVLSFFCTMKAKLPCVLP
ncbi:HTH_48 domain-containing protein [Trichonephila clavata]|uniref:HTH_48 domain-containing protein n=1 Tax=Trichonephila clavata TaxID=2740835 RepID=A0A8X6KP40_TRICU|nr:HTH_48 domain-containing protein [Trichonephila clavata]